VEEIQLRAAELIARAGTPDGRRRLTEKARRSSERVRRFILGRLAATGAVAPAPAERPPAPPAPSFEEYAFPVARSRPLAEIGGRA
jgi:hypothetical protein